MVITATAQHHPPHPLAVGAAPATIWAILLLLRLAHPVLLFAVALPAVARHHADTSFLATVLLISAGASIAWLVLTSRLRTALRLRVPGAMQTYDWNNPGVGPRASDLGVAGLSGIITTAAIASAAVTATTLDAAGASVIAWLLASVGTALITLGTWRAIRTGWDRLPMWGAEILLAVVGTILPGVAAVVAAITAVPAYDSITGWIMLALLFVLGVKTTAAMLRLTLRSTPTVRPPDGTVVVAHRSTLRKDIDEIVVAAADVVLNQLVASPSLSDREKAHRLARRVLYGGLIALGSGAFLLLS